MMLAKFIYKYFYTFFKVNLKSHENGKTKDPPWILSLIQVAAGISFISCDVFGIIIWLTGNLAFAQKINKFLFVFCYTAPQFIICYYILFVYLKASKVTGKTEIIEYEPEKTNTIFYYALFVITALLQLLLILLAHGIIKL